MAGTVNDNLITKFFTKNTAESICDYFESKSDKHESMAEEFLLYCCNEICNKNYQCHICNKAMNKCLQKFPKWRPHVTGGDKSITMKMNDNVTILSHQVLQMKKLKEVPASNPWKKEILKIIKDTKYCNDFDLLFEGMLYMIYLFKFNTFHLDIIRYFL